MIVVGTSESASLVYNFSNVTFKTCTPGNLIDMCYLDLFISFQITYDSSMNFKNILRRVVGENQKAIFSSKCHGNKIITKNLSCLSAPQV